MSAEEQLIDEMATLWVENGGDAEGIDWCWMRLKEAIEAKYTPEQIAAANVALDTSAKPAQQGCMRCNTPMKQAAEPVGEYVIVGRAELAMVRIALQRDADEGKQSRKAMLRALDESARPAQSHQPLTDDELRNVLRNTNHMIRNAMHGPFWPELEQACRAIEAAHGITSTNQGE